MPESHLSQPSQCKSRLKHRVKAGTHHFCSNDEPDPVQHREHVEPWLTALLQAEHLSVLIGSGFTTAVASTATAPPLDLSPGQFEAPHANAVAQAAAASAKRIGRGSPNLEDQARVIGELIGGLRVLSLVTDATEDAKQLRDVASSLLKDWKTELDSSLFSLVKQVLTTETAIDAALTDSNKQPERIRRLLAGFLLPFASRATSRERTHIFTTNYDRLIEYACDLLGLRLIDRFVGSLTPVFHSSRLGVDLHYNPPGIRGEPRYLEGVVRFTKLHGSVDWQTAEGHSGRSEVVRVALPFGAPDDHPGVPPLPGDQLLVYPNAAKEIATLEFPYAEMFRDFAAAVCQPNVVVVTYGYGFGDDHINRVLRDMLSIPSTHLVIISYDGAEDRLQNFQDSAGHEAQLTLLIGPHFAGLESLVEHYLPKPAIDQATWRMVEILNRRMRPKPESSSKDEVNPEPGDFE